MRATAIQAVAVLAATSGCAVELEDPADADDQAALDHVEALGFERGEARLRGDRVVVQGDILFDRQALLNGEYEHWQRREDDDLVEKGYQYKELVAEKNRGNLRLLFATGQFAPTREIRTAFVAAAKAWSQVPGSSIRISPDNTGPAIVVRTVPADRWDAYSGCKDTDACAFAPRDGRPGYDLFIRAESVDEGCAHWSTSGLAYAARHELGHAIGFAHPKEKGSKLVAGTQPCTLSAYDCIWTPQYPSVMAAPEIDASCTYVPARITKDDYAACAKVYPAP